MQLSNLLSVLVALGFVTKTHALRSSNEQLALAQLYDSASGTYSDYYVKDDGSYTSYITANVDWSYYEGFMEYFGLDDDCGYNLYYYTSDGVSQSSYVSADGEYLSYYDFITGEFYDFSYNYYFEDVSADGSVGSQYYLDSDGVYFTYINWDMTNGYYLEYIDLDTDIQYYADDMWYYTVYYNALTGDSDTYYADYFNEYTDDDTYYSVVYASPDWSEYHGSSYYTTDVMDVTYEFNSNGIDSTYVAYADGLYTSYYDGIADLFYETVYEAPVDVYYSNVSEDGTTYTYSFVDGDGCYSYSGIIENYDYDGTVYIDENGHATTYYSINSGCLNQYYDHLYEEYSEYHDLIDIEYQEGFYYSQYYYDGCYGEYQLYAEDYNELYGQYSISDNASPDCDVYYWNDWGVNGELCYVSYDNGCTGVYTEDYNEYYDEDYIVNESGFEYYYFVFENCDGTDYYIQQSYSDNQGNYQYFADDAPSANSYEFYWDQYYFVECDLIEDVCETYYADYYEDGCLDNGYCWEYYEDPHGIPCFGWEYNPIGFDEDSEYGVYMNYYEFDLAYDYFLTYREDQVGCYEDECVSYDGGVTEDCWSQYNSYYNEEITENTYFSEYSDCGEGAYFINIMYSYDNENEDEKYGLTYSVESGPEDYTNTAYTVYDDTYYELYCDFTLAAEQCSDIYYDYYELILDENCEGELWIDADDVYGHMYTYCEYDDVNAYYIANYPISGEGELYYYSNTWDTYYHVFCYDAASTVCETQYDDYYDAGTVYYAEGEVYYWEIYAMPDEQTYHGRHVHASLDGSSYSVYRFSEPDGVSFTYYETPEFASTYDYATGEYTEWLQNFYGEADAPLLQWYADAYVDDDSDRIDDFNAEMGTDHIHMDAYYDLADNLVVEITTELDAFYALYTVGDEINAEITYGDAFDSGDNYDSQTQTMEQWYTYYDINGNKFLVHNYNNDAYGQLGNSFEMDVDGQTVDVYYTWYSTLTSDNVDNDGMGYSVANNYDNEVYIDDGNFQAYYFLSDDATYSYYSSEFYGEDGVYRATYGTGDDLTTYYRSADGYFESTYIWITQTYIATYNDIYVNDIAEDGMSGYYSYTDPSGNYYVAGHWSIAFGVYSWAESDCYGEDIQGWSSDSGWEFYDLQYGETMSGSYDYFSQVTNEFGVTTTTYRSVDGSDWSVEDSWTDEMGHEVTRTFTAQGTRTYSYSIDGTHYYITDLNTGAVVVGSVNGVRVGSGSLGGESSGDFVSHFISPGVLNRPVGSVNGSVGGGGNSEFVGHLREVVIGSRHSFSVLEVIEFPSGIRRPSLDVLTIAVRLSPGVNSESNRPVSSNVVVSRWVSVGVVSGHTVFSNIVHVDIVVGGNVSLGDPDVGRFEVSISRSVVSGEVISSSIGGSVNSILTVEFRGVVAVGSVVRKEVVGLEVSIVNVDLVVVVVGNRVSHTVVVNVV